MTIKEITAIASAYERTNVVPAYYLECPETGEDGLAEYCEECAAKNANGWDVRQADSSAHYDSEPHCEECGKTLKGWLTDWGAETLLDVFESETFDFAQPSTAYAWTLAENSFLEGSDEHVRLMALLAPSGQGVDEPVPIGRCPKCGTPWYTDEGFCGGCKR